LLWQMSKTRWRITRRSQRGLMERFLAGRGIHRPHSFHRKAVAQTTSVVNYLCFPDNFQEVQ